VVKDEREVTQTEEQVAVPQPRKPGKGRQLALWRLRHVATDSMKEKYDLDPAGVEWDEDE
jgi:hypothetical protein